MGAVRCFSGIAGHATDRQVSWSAVPCRSTSGASCCPRVHFDKKEENNCNICLVERADHHFVLL